jgi:hypothetical protein
MFHFLLFSNASTKMAMKKYQLQTWGIDWASWAVEMICFCRRPSLQSRHSDGDGFLGLEDFVEREALTA